MQAMKIFVVGPEDGDFFTHNVAYTCRAMGHEVRADAGSASLAGKSRPRILAEDILSKSQAWRVRRERRIVNAASGFKPALTIVCTNTLEPETVATMRTSTGGRVICWYGDPPANLKRDHITAGEYDAVFVKDKRLARDLRDVLQMNAFHLHEACNPVWHRPVATERAEHVAVAGSLYGYRVAVIQKLVDAGCSVRAFGPRPASWVPGTVAELHTGIFLDQRNKAMEFGRALACLNTFAPAERDSLNCRVFETCGSGGLLVSEKKDAMDECFDADAEYLPFSSFDELIDQLDRARKDRATAERIRARAVRRAHDQHTYEHRIRFILQVLQA
jgi:spore maturation protein CgeB